MDSIAPSLTPAEEVFVEEYMSTLNKTVAYRKAYPEDTRKENATRRATEVLERPHVYAVIVTRLQTSLDAEVARSPNVLLKYIERFLEIDPTVYYEDDGRVRPLSDIPVEDRLLISNVNKQVNVKTGAIVLSYVLPDKSRLLDKLSELVRFVSQVRAMTGDKDNEVDEAAKKRKAVFDNFKRTSAEKEGFSVEVLDDAPESAVDSTQQ